MRRLTKKLLLLSRQLTEDYAGRKANDETVCWWRRLSHSWHTFSPTAASGISKITSCDWPTQKYLVALIRFGPISLTACVYLAPSGQRNNGSTVFSLPSKKNAGSKSAGRSRQNRGKTITWLNVRGGKKKIAIIRRRSTAPAASCRTWSSALSATVSRPFAFLIVELRKADGQSLFEVSEYLEFHSGEFHVTFGLMISLKGELLLLDL